MNGNSKLPHIAVIGGGPAGLRAAEVAAAAGAQVTLFDAKPSVGRKFLVAGKGGLNLRMVKLLSALPTATPVPANPADSGRKYCASSVPQICASGLRNLALNHLSQVAAASIQWP